MNAETLALRYIRFLDETQFHVTFRGYLPRNGALTVLLSPSVYLDHRLGARQAVDYVNAALMPVMMNCTPMASRRSPSTRLTTKINVTCRREPNLLRAGC